jgi:hypothetical protein
MDDEVLRQFVRRIKRRGVPRIPSDENLAAIALFLMHRDIEMLLEKELEEPEVPHSFVNFLLKFLRNDEHSAILPPPRILSGVFRGRYPSEDGSPYRWVNLTLDITEGDYIIRLSETSEIYATPLLFNKRVVESRQPSEGWAILTPEDNLLMFMKQKPYGHNYYYFTVALHPSVWSDTSAEQLALFRHAYPAECDPKEKSFEELMTETGRETAFILLRKREYIVRNA